MAAVGLAIIGKNNSPLYVREFLSEHDVEDGEDEAVLFGLKPLSKQSGIQEAPAASSRFWFALHAALDRLEQVTKTLGGKKKTTPGQNFVGLLYPSEETRVYGYITNTRTKFILIVEDEGPNEMEATAVDVQQLFEEIHELYVREVMNPFNRSNGNNNSNEAVESLSNQLSRKFDENIQNYIVSFNQPEI